MKNYKKIFLGSLLILSFVFSLSFVSSPKSSLNKKLYTYCKSLPSEFNQISVDRKSDLDEIANYISEQQKEGKDINLLFVCTSNSRRSHMAQVWSQIASVFYEVKMVSTFSGGTEQTKVNKNALRALEKTGIILQSNQQSQNPIWLATIGENIAPLILFSKKYTDSTNPSQNFGAVMVCSEADASCPIVDGADFRLGLPYQDPKLFDNTAQESEKYDERCRQIAREMFYVFSRIKK
ncbi:protein-tyrosine-phosphatase [Flavobacterium sp.]|uniref:protein-tyrosine-phosphatase n=1 Tax=Flavobacterium sp. TaxID=239 RepID=UPI00391C6815